MGFRRTLVGLKPLPSPRKAWITYMFQTDPRGVEAAAWTLNHPRLTTFQTDPRGVEASTVLVRGSPSWFQTDPRGVEAGGVPAARLVRPGFRRTLVGLKPGVPPTESDIVLSFRRTLVGLKQLPSGPSGAGVGFQTDPRGVEAYRSGYRR